MAVYDKNGNELSAVYDYTGYKLESAYDRTGKEIYRMVILNGIYATYSGGTVPAGTTLDQLSGIIVTAIYSDGSTVTVGAGDYTLSGTLMAGQDNIVTVTYQGMTATFTVTVNPESSDVYPAYYTLSAGADEITVPSGIPEQTITDLRWIVYPDKPAFDNCLTGAGTFPKTFSSDLTLANNFSYSLSSGNSYFFAMFVEPTDLNGGVEITVAVNTSTGIKRPAGSGSIVVKESGGWLYWIRVGNSSVYNNELTTTGSVTVKKAYAMLMTGTEYVDYSAAEMVSVAGGLDLIPGQNYSGNATGGVITLSQNGQEIGTQSTITSISISAGNTLSAKGGACVFRAGMKSKPSDWSYIKWCAVGDSLTDTSINATQKYQQIIAEETSIDVETVAKGGTGVYIGYDSGVAFYQRADGCRHDSDIVSILGSVNDHKIDNGTGQLIYVCKDSSGTGVAIDDYSSSAEYPLTDTLSDNTFVGYLTECVRVVQSRAPFAKFLIISGLYYSGIHSSYYTVFMDVTKRVADKMGIPYLDLYHSTYDGVLGTSNPLYNTNTIPNSSDMLEIGQIPGNVYGLNFCQIDTNTDFNSAYACAGAHPNNDYHEQFMAPQIKTELGKIIDTV